MGLALGEIQIEFSEYLPVMVRAFSPQRVWGGGDETWGCHPRLG
jgi:hypothetical protein